MWQRKRLKKIRRVNDMNMKLLQNKPMPLDLLRYDKPSLTELEHHGIKGQTWGDQNGPPYPLKGSQRSAAEKKKGTPVSKFAQGREERRKKKAAAKIEKAKVKDEAKVIKTDNKKAISKMRDKDLKESINRLEQEKKYKDLYNEVYSNEGKAYLKKKVSEGASNAVGSAVQSLLSRAAIDLGQKGLKKMGIDIGDSNQSLKGLEAVKKELGVTKKALDDAKKDYDKVLANNKKVAGMYKEKNKEFEEYKKNYKSPKVDKATWDKKKSKSNGKPEHVSGTVEGEGTSKYSYKDTVHDLGYQYYREASSNPVPSSPAYIAAGERYLLEMKRG